MNRHVFRTGDRVRVTVVYSKAGAPPIDHYRLNDRCTVAMAHPVSHKIKVINDRNGQTYDLAPSQLDLIGE